MAISSIGSASTSTIFADRAASRSKRAEQMLEQADTDRDGGVSKAELSALGAKLQANRPAGDAAAPSPLSPAEMFSSSDKNGDASLSLDELTAMMTEAETRAKSGANGPVRQGPPPGGGAGGPPPGSAGGKSASSETTEPADTNHDGTVSAAEKLLYELTHPAAEQS